MLRNRRALVLLAVALWPAAALAAPGSYDVAYLWHRDLPRALERKRAVAKVLGPRVARDLRVVAADGAYAVIYLRQGDAQGARVAAAAHARLLRRKGEGSAWSIASREWVEVSEDGRALPEAPEEPAKTAAAHGAEKRGLEQLLSGRVEQLRREGRLAPDERTAWSVYDFTTGETLAEINGDLELQSASLVKPFLALAYMNQVQKGRLRYDAFARRQMTKMIQVSDNAAADWVMRRVGGPPAVSRILHEQFGAILPGVEIKEYIPGSGRTYRNKASVRDYSRFLLALWRDELPGSREIKRLMALPKRDRLKTGVPLPRGVQVYSKTGSTSHLCGDMGVLMARGPDGRQYAYALVGIIEKQSRARHYISWLRSRGNVIRYMSYLVYRRISAEHGLALR